jgi:hypothetical protein
MRSAPGGLLGGSKRRTVGSLAGITCFALARVTRDGKNRTRSVVADPSIADVNLNSPDQVAKPLFERLGADPHKADPCRQ